MTQPLNLAHIQAVVELVSRTQVAEVFIQDHSDHIRIKNSPTVCPLRSEPALSADAVSAKLPANQQPVNQAADDTSSNELMIRSTLIGRLQRCPDAASPACIEVGASVAVGDIIGYVAALAQLQPIISDVAGTVSRVLDEGAKVEYDTVIAWVTPN